MKRNCGSLKCVSQHQDKVAEMAKRCTPSQTDVIFVAMDALVKIYEDDLIATGNVTAMLCPYSLAHVSRLSSLHSRQAEDEDEVAQVQDDWFHLAEFHSLPLFFRVFCFLASSLVSNFAIDLPRKFLKGISRKVRRMGKCQDKSVGRIQRSLFWSSKTRPD